MASDFVGYSVIVTLLSPHGAQIQGVVEDVRDQNLHLQNVTMLWSGQHLATHTIKSHLIADLEISSARPEMPSEVDLKTPTVAAPLHLPPPPTQQPFVDPAILSYDKPRDVQKDAPKSVQPTARDTMVSPVMIANGAVPSPASNRPGQAGRSSVSSIATTLPVQKPHTTRSRKDSSATATLTEPFDALALNGEEVGESQNGTKKSRRGRNANPANGRTATGVVAVKEITTEPQSAKKRTVKDKGWRQTQLLVEETNPKRNKRRGKNAQVDDANGWATEDATDIQDMGDFDFASNLSKFDKRQVFNDIRKDDTIATEDRLVSFNRIARPGTNGGRNLHFTENVLDSQSGQKWQSEAGETEDEVKEEHYSSGVNSKRAGSRKPVPSRKGSAFPNIPQGLRTESPRPLTRIGTASPMNGSISGIKASFRMGDTNKPCHSISPLQMLELEQLCVTEFSLTEDILAENAGRSIAEAVLMEQPQTKTVLLLVGNHKSGARAVAAARHLRNRRLRVTVCVLGGERSDDLLEALRKQLAIYQKGGGYVDRWDEFQTKMAAGPQPDMIVDALFGVHVTFDELRTDDQATAFTMIRWANRSAAAIMSVDVPSGLSATTGVVTEVESEALIADNKFIVSLAAPKTGLLHAMAEMEEPSAWQVLVADIGISAGAWQKHGSRRRHGVEFGSGWVVRLKFLNRSSDS